MRISEIDPIDKMGIDLRKEENIEKAIEQYIELPVREAVREFTKRGIKTVMSSANYSNILPNGKQPKEKYDVDGQEYYFDRSTFDDAGKGYAWVMLDFDSLSDENKNRILEAEEKVGGEKVWFAQAYRYYIGTESKVSPFPKNLIDQKFMDKMITIGYNSDYYGERVIFLRKRVFEDSTVDEVSNYFLNWARYFVPQKAIGIDDNRMKKGEYKKETDAR